MSENTELVLRLLRQTVHHDPELQARMFALTDIDQFIAEVCAMARTSGYELEYKDVRQAMYAGRKAWSDRQRP